MSIRRAKILEDKDLNKVLIGIDKTSRYPTRDKLAVLFTAKAGLRVKEVAGLSWRHVTKADGDIADYIFLASDITKRERERTIPMNKTLKTLLIQYKKENPNTDRLFRFSLRSKKPAHALVMWFKRLYEKNDLFECSSHSGRRTFITSMGRVMNDHQCSLKDIQLLAGHANIATTERYLEPQQRIKGLIDAI